MMVQTNYYKDVPCKIALIADSHNRPISGLEESLSRNRPDFICIAGDFVFGDVPKHGLKITESINAVNLIRGCISVASTFISLGNHEYLLSKEDLEYINNMGATLLDNKWIEINGIVVGGLTSGGVINYRKYRASLKNNERYPKPLPEPRTLTHDPELNWLSEYEKQPGYKILLCHQPEYYTKYIQDTPIDLILSGHAHGGQIRIGNRGLYAPDQGLWPKFTSGVYDNRLVVSRGIANSSRIPRINNPPEIVYIVPLESMY